MKFQTEVEIPEFPWRLGYRDKITLMGSCFAESIGEKLEQNKYSADVNPFGILYNPFSIADALQKMLGSRAFSASDLVFYDGLWHSFSHHGKFSAINRDDVLSAINGRLVSSREFLKSAGFLFLTFGTAWVYRLSETGQVVSNCHKIPAAKFTRSRLKVEEIAEMYVPLMEKLWSGNPGLKIIFTVSPIRHWKDGAIENQASKATLILAIQNLLEKFGTGRCGYFPSYEIVMDELRDYRFYADDMLHLSPVAVARIWEKFEESLIDAVSVKISNEIEKIRKACEHRPINPETGGYNDFLRKMSGKVNKLSDEYPYLDLSSEKKYFEDQLNREKGVL